MGVKPVAARRCLPGAVACLMVCIGSHGRMVGVLTGKGTTSSV
jgi:hypothetical protein